MKLTRPIHTCRSVKAALTMVAIMALTCVANGSPIGFTEDFGGNVLDPAWTQASYLPGHLGLTGAGEYELTALQGGGNNPKLQRFGTGDASPLTDYVHNMTVNLDAFQLTGSGGTQSDFKWKSFGADGFMEVIMNSFGDVRVWHNNTAVGNAGNLVPNTNIGVADGDSLDFRHSYNSGADTVDISYSINGAPHVSLHNGTGNGGSIGNVIGNFVEIEVFKWGAAVDVPLVGVDEWNLNVVPEPATLGLLGMSAFGLFIVRRFRLS